MPESPDLLRDAEVLRKLLTECLRRVNRLERQLRIEAASAVEEERRPAPPLTDPFEQALPDSDEQAGESGGGPVERPPRPEVPRRQPSTPQRSAPMQPTARPLPSPRPHSDPSHDPHAGPPASHRTPGPLDGFGEVDDWNAEPSPGDGSLDPFALLDLSVPPPESHDATVSRAMNDLLGGLDVTPPHDDA
jgi:hypothetical protein